MSRVLVVLLLNGFSFLFSDVHCRVVTDMYGSYNTFDHMGAYTQQAPMVDYPPKVSTPAPTSSPPSQHFNYPPRPSVEPSLQPQLQAPPHDNVKKLSTPSPLQAPAVEGALNRSGSPDHPPATNLTLNSRQSQGSQPGTPNQEQPGITRVPLYMYNPGLARKLGISTFMMGSVLYGLSLVPALLALGVSSGFGPLSGFLGGLGRKRKRRSTPPLTTTAVFKFRELPLMDNRSTRRFLALVANTMELRKVNSPSCRRYYVCEVYKSAMDTAAGGRPSLADFEIAIVDTFGLAAERIGFKVDLIPEVKNYLDSALVGMTKGNCTKVFPCSQTFFGSFPGLDRKSGSHSGRLGRSLRGGGPRT